MTENALSLDNVIVCLKYDQVDCTDDVVAMKDAGGVVEDFLVHLRVIVCC